MQFFVFPELLLLSGNTMSYLGAGIFVNFDHILTRSGQESTLTELQVRGSATQLVGVQWFASSQVKNAHSAILTRRGKVPEES